MVLVELYGGDGGEELWVVVIVEIVMVHAIAVLRKN